MIVYAISVKSKAPMSRAFKDRIVLISIPYALGDGIDNKKCGSKNNIIRANFVFMMVEQFVPTS